MADDDDPTTHLSDEELHDLAVVCVAKNDLEAIYLSSRLDDAGIPNSTLSQSVQYTSPHPEIRVPRVLLAKAREIIQAAQTEAHDRAIENAFDPEAAVETRYRDGHGKSHQAAIDFVTDSQDERSTLKAMQALAESPYELRVKDLQPWVLKWLVNGEPELDIARYLAAAALTQDEAARLLEDVKQKQKATIESGRRSNRDTGLLLLGLAITTGIAIPLLSIVDPSLFTSRNPGVFWIVPGGLAITAFYLLHSSSGRAPSLQRRSEREP